MLRHFRRQGAAWQAVPWASFSASDSGHWPKRWYLARLPTVAAPARAGSTQRPSSCWFEQGDRTMNKSVAALLALLVPIVFLAAADDEKPKAPQKAVAVIHQLGKSKVHGMIEFTQEDGYIHITGEIV